MLTGPGIVREIKSGKIVIDPFDPDCVNPNSYDLHLGRTLLIYSNSELFVGTDNPATKVEIGSNGFRLEPGTLYLGTTLEWTETHAPWAPSISGKSSLGRLGLNIHATAGFGDVGFCGEWTMELFVIQPLTVHVGMRVCQIVYHRTEGEIQKYNGRYQNQREPQASRIEK